MKKTDCGKIVDRPDIASTADVLKKSGKRIVFTNGCFDIIHAGHVTYLKAAADFGDILIVGLNSDRSVREIKGEKRPIVEERARAMVLAALASVDFVVIFDEPDPGMVIREVSPDVLVKGADWSEDKIIGGEYVKSYGGSVERIDLVPAISTTTIIERIVERYGTGS